LFNQSQPKKNFYPMRPLIVAAVSVACLLPSLSFAADQILVEAKATRVAATGKEEVITSPHAVTSDGTRATLSVTRAVEIPESVGGADELVHTGSILDVTPTIDGDSIRFRTHLIVREASDERTSDTVRSVAVTTHELFSSGSVQAGRAVSLKTTNDLGAVLTWTIKLSKFPD
jgi:type II secretory pathway component HofQ